MYYGLCVQHRTSSNNELGWIGPSHLCRPIGVHKYGNPIPLVETEQAKVVLSSSNDPSCWEGPPNDDTMVFKRPDLRNLPQRLLQPAAYPGEHRAFRIHGFPTKHPQIGSEKVANNRPCFSMTFLRRIPHAIGHCETLQP